jgi:hypothetical protein
MSVRRPACFTRQVRGSFPGPSRRITVEPIRIPAKPKIVPSTPPVKQPARRPAREPVPAR